MYTELSNEINEWCDEVVSQETAGLLDSGECSPLPLYQEICQKGWMNYANIAEDKQYFFHLAEVCKVANAYSGVLGNMICVNSACAMILGAFGNAEAKQFAQGIIEGKKLAAFSLTEPQAGTDVNNIQASATLDGDEWVIDGEKYLVTGAMLADAILVVVKTNPDVATKNGSSMLLVSTRSKGMEITPTPKMSANGYASCHIRFTGCRAPSDRIIGKVNGAWAAMSMAGGIERVLVAACCVGLCKRIGEYLYEYSNDRIVDGKPLYELSNIRHQIVDIAIKVRAADALVGQAISALASGTNATNAVCAAKVFAAQMQQEVSMTAMNVMGGRAYLKAYPVERWLREGLLSLWAGGTNELQKNLMSRSPFDR